MRNPFKKSTFDIAHEQREMRQFQNPMLAAYDSPYLRKVRKKNISKKNYPAIRDLVSATVHYTMDTNQPVISLRAADGAKCSLWTDSEGNIRSITEY